VLVMSTGPYV